MLNGKAFIGALAPLLCLAITGCASAVTYDQYLQSVQPPESGNGRVYVYRVDTVGTAIRPSIILDGEILGRAVPNRFYYRDVPAGQHEVTVSTESKSKLSFAVAAGKEVHVKIEVRITPASWHVTPVLVLAETAQEEIRATKRGS